MGLTIYRGRWLTSSSTKTAPAHCPSKIHIDFFRCNECYIRDCRLSTCQSLWDSHCSCWIPNPWLEHWRSDTLHLYTQSKHQTCHIEFFKMSKEYICQRKMIRQKFFFFRSLSCFAMSSSRDVLHASVYSTNREILYRTDIFTSHRKDSLELPPVIIQVESICRRHEMRCQSLPELQRGELARNYSQKFTSSKRYCTTFTIVYD